MSVLELHSSHTRPAGQIGRSAAEVVMGRLATFAELGSDLFERVIAGADHDLTGCRVHSIDKAWDGLHLVLRSNGPPLSLAITGDCRHPQGGHSLDEFIQGDRDYYIALMSPRLVQEIAAALTNVTAKKLKQWESELGVERDSSVDVFLPQLKAAYREAAAEKNGLMIVIG
jgi:Domain of unknown function (DUF1877)